MRILGLFVAAILGRQRLAITFGPSFCRRSSITVPAFSGVSSSPRRLISSRTVSPIVIMS